MSLFLRAPVGLLIVLIISLMISGCTGLKVRKGLREKKTPIVQKAPQEFDHVEEKKPESLLAESSPIEVVSPKVAVILGPGGVKAFAHAGILKELVKARIPINTVVGIEWGSLVGALYAKNGKIHEMEWKLYKLQKTELSERDLLSTGFKATPIKVLEKYFRQNLNGVSISQAKLEFACPSLSIWSGTLVWQTRGQLDRVLSKCMPYPPLFRPSSPWIAAAFAVEDAIHYLKKRGHQIIIYVNILGTGELFNQNELLKQYPSALLWQEIRRFQKRTQKLATDVIEVDTREYKMFDFSNHTNLVGAGELVGRRFARKLAQKYGF